MAKGNWKDHLITKLEEYDCSAVVGAGGDDEDGAGGAGGKFGIQSLGSVEGGHGGAGGAAGGKNGRGGEKRKEMLENKHSSGQAAYIFDILDVYFLGEFVENCNAIFEAFETEKAPEDQVDALPPVPNDKHKYINVIQFDMGCHSYKWGIKKSPSALFNEMDVKSANGLNMKEIIYSAIYINKQPGLKCTHCFEKLKEEIGEFFDFIDCNKDG